MVNVLDVNTKKEDLRKALEIMFKAQTKVQDVRISGLGRLSREVLKIAKANQIELNKDIELMKHLAKLESTKQISEELYPAVAEILARMYRVSKQAYHIN